MYNSLQTFKKKCKNHKCITRKIRKLRPNTVHYSYIEKSIQIKNDFDMNHYFKCYKIQNIVKKLCKKWISLGGGCFLDYSPIYCGTIYLTKTVRTNYYNHIHIFPSSKYSFDWHDKMSKTSGIVKFSKSIDECIETFTKLLNK